MSGRHALEVMSDDGRYYQVAGPVVFLDAFRGWVRETTLGQGQYATEVVDPAVDALRGYHRAPSHRRPSHAFVSADPLTAVLVSASGHLERPSRASG
jgi:hypothetical protein